MRRPDFFKAILPLTLFGLVGCAEVTPTANPETPLESNPSALVGPVSTETPTYFATPNYDPTVVALSTPEPRSTAMWATANAVGTQGPEGLVAKGFPNELITSQRHIIEGVDVRFDFNGQEYHFPTEADLYSTIINLDGTIYDGNILIATAGHGQDPELVGRPFLDSIHTNLGAGEVVFKEVDVLTLKVHDKLTLDRRQFGLVHQSKLTTDDYYTDFSLILVPKANIPNDVLTDLMTGAIPFNQISFSKPTGEIYNICYPVDTSPNPITIEKANVVAEMGQGIVIKSGLTGGGCSGSGIGEVDENGQFKLIGINVANFAASAGFGDLVAIHSYYCMGEQRFIEALNAAKIDIDLQANNPIPTPSP